MPPTDPVRTRDNEALNGFQTTAMDDDTEIPRSSDGEIGEKRWSMQSFRSCVRMLRPAICRSTSQCGRELHAYAAKFPPSTMLRTLRP